MRLGLDYSGIQANSHPSPPVVVHAGAQARDIAKYVADALEDKGLTGVINAPDPQAMSRPELRPYVDLATRLGALCAQMVNGKVRTLGQRGPA